MNRFKELLTNRAQHPPLGTWMMSASPLITEAIGYAGFDWAVVDMEHTPLDLATVVHVLQAAAGTPMHPVVRIPWNDSVMIKRVLDAGATTLLIPFVQDAADARAAVAATRYPPSGTRGMAAMTRASQFGSVADHYRVANDNIGVIVQLESPSALQRLEEIAAVDGVDALFIGPADLSGALGHPGDMNLPELTRLTADAVRRANALGIPIGTVGPSLEAAARYREMGFDFVAIGSDMGLLMRALRDVVAGYRGLQAP